MKILFLATEAYGGNGGIAKFNRDLIRAVCAHSGITQLTVFTRSRIADGHGNFEKKIKYLQPTGKISYALHLFQEMFYENKQDVLICGHIHFLCLAWIVSLIWKIRVVLIIHGIEAWQKPKYFLSQWLSRVCSVISVSEFSMKKFSGWSGFNRPHFIFPNCIDLNNMHSNKLREDLVSNYKLKGKKVMMTLARLAPQERYKGIDEVIEAIPCLLKRVPNIVYLVCGSGDDQPRLEKKVEDLNLNSYVIFTGFVPENEKIDYFRLADAFVMPGRGEGFGIVYLEALACGVPVVGSKLDGSREALMNGRLGVLVDSSNQQELIEGILEALGRPKGIIPADLSYFSYDAFEKRTHAILDQI